MTNLLIAASFWILSHFALSSTPLRAMLVKRFGEKKYLLIYSLIAISALAYFIWSYTQLGMSDQFWTSSMATRWASFLLMPLAFIFIAGSFVTTNPTVVGQGYKLKKIAAGAGMIRITRHPFQWGVFIWALAHILANGDFGSLIFFGTFSITSLIGTLLIDRKKSAKGDDWKSFKNVTSNLPFWAIYQRTNHFKISELWLPICLGLLAHGVLLWGHKYYSGVALF